MASGASADAPGNWCSRRVRGRGRQMWVGQAGGFGGGRGLHSHTDGSRVPELSRSDLLSSQGDASKRSGRLDPTLLNRRARPRLILVPVLASALATPEAPVAYPGRPDLPEV